MDNIRDPKDNSRIAIFDEKIQMPVTCGIELCKLDAGLHFFYKDVLEFLTDAPETKTLVVVSPSSPVKVYFRFRASGNTEFAINIIEGVTCDVMGTQKVLCNNDRECPTAASTQVFSDPVDPVGGSVIWPARISSPSEKTPSSPTVAEMNYPIRLKSNTKYLVQMNKIDSNTGYLDIDAWWFEHIDE
jgi:hypothetical protein